MKIHIFYRHYNVSGNDGPRRPKGFDYEECYKNLLATSDLNTCKINIIYDSKEDNWVKHLKYDNLYEIDAKGDMASFFQTCGIIKDDESIQDGDLIYFLENDYKHVYGWWRKILELFQTYKGLDYVSLYDHKDKYFLPMYDDLVSKVFTTENHHWRSTPSTCGSFVVTKERFLEDFDILSTMSGDHNKWLWLNQNRSRTVISPIPGLSTHCMQGLMSPTIKWNEI